MVDDECEDSVCVRRVLKGERHAYDEIVSRHENRIFSLVLMMIRDRPSAEEITQDAFLRAYSNLARYDLCRPFYPWLATIASRLAINWIHRSGAMRTHDDDTDPAQLPVQAPTPLDELQTRQVERKLWDHVAELPRGERTAVLMFYKHELNVGEIAGILGVTSGTIKTFLHRGRSHLKTLLQSGETK